MDWLFEKNSNNDMIVISSDDEDKEDKTLT